MSPVLINYELLAADISFSFDKICVFVSEGGMDCREIWIYVSL